MESQLGRFREYDRDAEGGAETPGYDPSARIGPRFEYNRLVRLMMMAHTKKEARVVGERRCGGARGRRDDQRAAAETGHECLSDECSGASLGDDDSASKGSRCQKGAAHAAAEGAVIEFPAAESVLLAARELRSQCGKSPFWRVEGFIPSADGASPDVVGRDEEPHGFAEGGARDDAYAVFQAAGTRESQDGKNRSDF